MRLSQTSRVSGVVNGQLVRSLGGGNKRGPVTRDGETAKRECAHKPLLTSKRRGARILRSVDVPSKPEGFTPTYAPGWGCCAVDGLPGSLAHRLPLGTPRTL